MSDVTLFGTRISPFVEKVARALALKGIEFRTRDVKSPGDLKRWNPTTGKMPVLELDGERLYDSSFILRRLDERQPEPPLFSEDSGIAAQQRLLEDWCDESLYWHVMASRWSGRNRAATTAQITAGLPAPLRPLAGLLLRRQLGGASWAQGLGRLPHDRLLREFADRLDDLVLMLAGRPFFFSERVGAADLALYGELATARSGPTPDLETALAERPVLADHAKRVEEATGG